MCVLANRIIKWTMIHHRQVMGIETFSSYFSAWSISVLLVFLFRLSLASVFIWFTHWLSFSKARCCSPPHCYSSFLCPSVSILARSSLFPLTPLSFRLSLCISLTPLLSLLPASLHRYPNTFIFPPLPIHSIGLPHQCCQHFSLFSLLQLLLPPLLFQSLSPHYYLTAMFLCFICQAWCFHILLAYGELSLLYRSHQYLYRLVNPISSKQMVSYNKVLMKVFLPE